MDQWARIANRNKKKLLETAQKAIIAAGTNIAVISPVDTGFFRSEWGSGINSQAKPSGRTRPTFSLELRAFNPLYDGEAPLVATAKKLKIDDTFYFTNPTSYGPGLEYGSSPQAPQGMVRLTVADWNGFVNRAARSVR